MSYVGFKYCPFCGGEMPQNNMMKFCPFCGEEHSLSDKKKLDIDKREMLAQQTPSINKDIENKKTHEISITSKFQNMQLQEVEDFEYCSIMLKYAIDANILIESLKKVLLRSVFAIRLAVDNMPSLIVYKAKKEDIIGLYKIFMESQSSISMIPGEFNDSPSIEEVFSKFNKLSLKMQEDIRSIPLNLWIGDSISGIFAIRYGESKDGILVITNKNIYILYKYAANTEFRWLIISYALLLKIVGKNNSLQFIYNNERVESVDFFNNLELVEAFKTISHIVMI
ncbi:MAG: hypothetical protein K0R78_2674 [Pelosinus sp.]|jgi:hypothetical protein|nr:hypothetical protein [Pelosinus sp.]